MSQPDLGPGGFQHEGAGFIELPSIEPKMLLADNRSERAVLSRETWRRARRSGQLTGVRGCADARILIGDPITTRVRTIAAAGPEREYAGILGDPGIDKIVIIAHFSGSKVRPGEMPEGCGGLLAKRGDLPEGPLGRFIGEDIVSDDILVQTLYSAAATSREAGSKPTLATLQDHETGRLLPIAVFSGGDTIVSAVHFEDLLNFNPSTIYANGIPELQGNKIPGIFDAFLEAHAGKMEQVRTIYPDLREKQRVQNPATVVISAEARPLQEIFPTTFEEPGSVFKISIPRSTIDSVEPIEGHPRKLALGQALYAIGSSADNHGTERPFAGTNTVLIETGDLDVSRELAGELLDYSAMQAWINLPRRRVLVSEMVEGLAQRIEVAQLD